MAQFRIIEGGRPTTVKTRGEDIPHVPPSEQTSFGERLDGFAGSPPSLKGIEQSRPSRVMGKLFRAPEDPRTRELRQAVMERFMEMIFPRGEKA